MLELIDTHGIHRIRTVGEQINNIVYHMVLYRSFDDDLQVVYSAILKQIRFLQLRDIDSLHLLNKREYNLIKLIIDKYTARINIS